MIPAHHSQRRVSTARKKRCSMMSPMCSMNHGDPGNFENSHFWTQQITFVLVPFVLILAPSVMISTSIYTGCHCGRFSTKSTSPQKRVPDDPQTYQAWAETHYARRAASSGRTGSAASLVALGASPRDIVICCCSRESSVA